VRGPQVMKGYWQNPVATEQALQGGRFHTGDIGFVSADGFLTLVDRKKDMILSSGYNVFPRNVEVLENQTDSFIEKCLDNPQAKAEDVMLKLKK